jgi:hypothetical protein
VRIKRALAAFITSLALVTLGVGPASAGEITGNGKPTQGPAHARSVCAFSGQNDTPDAEGPEGGRTQSYGQLVRQGLKGVVPGPGVACNPTSGFEE